MIVKRLDVCTGVKMEIGNMIFDLYLLTNLWALWVGLLLIFLLTEGLSQNFVTVWLALGSLAGLLAERLTLPFIWQIVVFAIVSLLCIIFLRPFCFRVLHSKTQLTNIAALIGQKALIIKKIEPFEVGQAKVGGQVWSAISVDDQPLAEGSCGLICEIRGVKLVLKPDTLAKPETGTAKPMTAGISE